MAADELAGRPAASPRVRLRWLLVVVTVMAFLTAGWPLLNAAVSDEQALAPGTMLTIGTGPASSAEVTVGPGWSVLLAQSNPHQSYLLGLGAARLAISHVAIIDGSRGPQLWAGLRQTLAVTHPDVRLSKPEYFITKHGLHAVRGFVTSPKLFGTATIFPGPSNRFAIEMIVFASRQASPVVRAAALQIMLSLHFAAITS